MALAHNGLTDQLCNFGELRPQPGVMMFDDMLNQRAERSGFTRKPRGITGLPNGPMRTFCGTRCQQDISA